jgi:probable rRNA maturation factor
MKRTAPRTRLAISVQAPDGVLPSTRGLARWLAATAPARAAGEVTVAVVSDRRMRALNRVFRGKDVPTDVLSFPTDADVGAPVPGQPRLLGDIVIASGVARAQAAREGHSLTTELRVLALHGLLHLLGYDHETDDGQMARVEARLRRKGGLPSGLIARGARPRV